MARTETDQMTQSNTSDKGGAVRFLNRLALVGAMTLAAGLLLAAGAQSAITFKSSFGGPGTTGGTFNQPTGIAVNNETGNVYVVDRVNNRIEQFTSAGAFVRMWGADVIQSGPDDNPVNEVQAVTIRSDSGTFTLTFGANTTTPLPYNATAGEVQAALNALASINTGGGSVTVTKEADPEKPYLVEFGGGPLANTDVSQMTINGELLGVPVGTQLTCTPQGSGNISYQWLTNGEPSTGPGATSNVYTTAAADAGKPVQCQITIKSENSGTTSTFSFTSRVPVVSPYPATDPPVGPTSISTPTPSNPTVGTLMTCAAGSWTGAPTFTYRWYKDGVAIPGAVSSTYTLTAADVPGNIGCAALGTNAGGTVLKTNYFPNVTNPAPSPEPPGNQSVTISLPASAISTATTQVGGASGFEICPAPPTTDVCKAGRSGGALGQFNTPRGIAVDNSASGSHAVYVVDDNNFRVQKFTSEGQRVWTMGWEVNKTTAGDMCTAASGNLCGAGKESTDGTPGRFGVWPTSGSLNEFGNEVTVDSSANLYVTDTRNGSVVKPSIEKFDSSGNFLGQVTIPTILNPGFYPKPVSITVDPTGLVYAALNAQGIEYFEPSLFTPSGEGASSAGSTLSVGTESRHLAIDPRNGFLVATDQNGAGLYCGAPFVTGRAIAIYDTDGEKVECIVPTGVGVNMARINGSGVAPNGLLYLSERNSNTVRTFELPTPKAPTIGSEAVGNITTESAVVSGQVNPQYGYTKYGVEFGLVNCESLLCQKVDGGELHPFTTNRPVQVPLEGLEDGTKYHYRLVAENGEGPVAGPDQTFVTYPALNLLKDPCPNALARQQTGAAQLFDCRAYELVSADFSGGYDVESDLIAGQTPFASYPDATDRVLYSVHGGGIPGTGLPTNRGRDPYVATRGSDGLWTTKYVGVPSDVISEAPFTSGLLEADPALGTFAFGGPEFCSPCFPDGSTGIPVRFPDGTLAQGMHGLWNQGASAKADGLVMKYFSADGTHFVFGSLLRYQPDGNNNTGDVSIYDRNLSTGVTQVVSKSPGGENLTCLQGAGTCHSPTNTAGIAELDISSDGSRIVVGQRIATDTAGNNYWHPYMHIGTNGDTVDLAPGTTTGVVYAGMTSDGSKVYFTTADKLLGADEDTSPDLYVAEAGTSGPATLKLLSAPAPAPEPGNVDTCDPASNLDGNNWNAVGGASANTCGVVAIGGGGGIAGETGVAYFLSPEALGGSGVANEPNLFAVEPGGALKLVATLEVNNSLVRDAVKDSEVHRYGDFQTTPAGDFAAFATTKPLDPGYKNAGFAEVYRYELAGGTLACASCIPTELSPTTNASLPANGLALEDHGRVFFNSREQLTAVDKNGNQDVYEWTEGKVQLISSGTSPQGVGLLGVSREGKDAYFFTRDTLVSNDHNGQAMKVYDAREEGGRFVVPPEPPCAASDECHGPGTQAAAPPQVGSYSPGKGGQATPCRPGYVKRHGKCVNKHHKRKHHRRSGSHHA
jgi:hypothetical protein